MLGKKNNKEKTDNYYDEYWTPLTDEKQFSKYKSNEQIKTQLDEVDKLLLKRKDGTIAEYKEITMDYYITHGYKLLLLTREKNLTWLQKLRFRQIINEFDPHWYMADARIRKEMFIDALDDLDIEEIRRVKDGCLISTHYRIKAFGRTLQKRDKQLESYCKNSTKEFKFTNAFTESINNQSKIAKHVSMWFRYKDNYRKKLYCRFHPLRGWM